MSLTVIGVCDEYDVSLDWGSGGAWSVCFENPGSDLTLEAFHGWRGSQLAEAVEEGADKGRG